MFLSANAFVSRSDGDVTQLSRDSSTKASHPRTRVRRMAAEESGGVQTQLELGTAACTIMLDTIEDVLQQVTRHCYTVVWSHCEEAVVVSRLPSHRRSRCTQLASWRCRVVASSRRRVVASSRRRVVPLSCVIPRSSFVRGLALDPSSPYGCSFGPCVWSSRLSVGLVSLSMSMWVCGVKKTQFQGLRRGQPKAARRRRARTHRSAPRGCGRGAPQDGGGEGGCRQGRRAERVRKLGARRAARGGAEGDGPRVPRAHAPDARQVHLERGKS